MSDTVKLIIEIPKAMYECVRNGTYCGSIYPYLDKAVPLDDIKAEIRTEQEKYSHPLEIERAIEILDNIGKPESEEI